MWKVVLVNLVKRNSHSRFLYLVIVDSGVQVRLASVWLSLIRRASIRGWSGLAGYPVEFPRCSA